MPCGGASLLVDGVVGVLGLGWPMAPPSGLWGLGRVGSGLYLVLSCCGLLGSLFARVSGLCFGCGFCFALWRSLGGRRPAESDVCDGVYVLGSILFLVVVPSPMPLR